MQNSCWDGKLERELASLKTHRDYDWVKRNTFCTLHHGDIAPLPQNYEHLYAGNITRLLVIFQPTK
jgi:hypothetical protein